MTVTLTCFTCETKFQKPSWELRRRGKRDYCSKDCYLNRPKGLKRIDSRLPQEKVCIVCDAKFLVGGRGNRGKKTLCCSSTCRGLSRYRNGKICKELSAVDAAHMAGLIEGEGSIILFMNGDVVTIRVTLANTDFGLMNKIKEVVGLGSIVRKLCTNKRHSASAQWVINANAAESFIKQIRPYMWMKTEQADLALETRARLRDPKIKADRSWHLPYCERMRELNARGPKQPKQVSLALDNQEDAQAPEAA